jgi:ABC-type glutathione transport system ATPase component
MTGLGIGPNCVALAVEGAFFICLLLLIEKFDTLGFHSNANKNNTVGDVAADDQDTDVFNERVRVRDGGAKGEMVVAHELIKSFGDSPKLAVDRVSFGVPKGQCFGLLGTNGAGKTTCFRMITGETSMTGGGAVVNGSDVATNLVSARRYMGYAPQYDGLIPHLTGRDHLFMFARLRGE